MLFSIIKSPSEKKCLPLSRFSSGNNKWILSKAKDKLQRTLDTSIVSQKGQEIINSFPSMVICLARLVRFAENFEALVPLCRYCGFVGCVARQRLLYSMTVSNPL